MKNLIEEALKPMKVEAMRNAEVEARRTIARVHGLLEESCWNLDVVAPFPKSTMDKASYRKALAKRSLFKSLTVAAQTSRSMTDPDFRKPSQELQHRFIVEAEQATAAEFDSFVTKLTAKIGECTSCQHSAGATWSFSILTITKPNGKVERWQTQQIINVSKLGKLFNQWPTRKLKA